MPEGAYTDDGDLIVEKDHGPLLVEVKRLSRNFRKGQWPFGDEFIVDRCATLNKKHPTPDHYIAVSCDLGAYGLLDLSKHYDDMFEISRNNPSWGTTSPYYAVTKDLVYFEDVDLMLDGYK